MAPAGSARIVDALGINSGRARSVRWGGPRPARCAAHTRAARQRGLSPAGSRPRALALAARARASGL
eukprot:3268395-Prymnesium_polylepis.1